MGEPYYAKVEREACERVSLALALPTPQSKDEIGDEGIFSPWDLFPYLYGTYSSDFDETALAVLGELLVDWDEKVFEDDLASHMFKEMLCTAGLCDYGTSPRACFPTDGFRELLPELIEKWKQYSALHWGLTPQTPSDE